MAVPQTSNVTGKTDRQVGLLETAGDVALSAGAGLRAGAEALVGLPGDVEDGVASAYEFVRGLISDETPEEKEKRLAVADSVAAPGLPSTSTIRSVTNKVLGQSRQPTTTAGEFAKTIGEFVPAVAAGPGAIARKGAAAVASGGASEAAGQLTEGTAAEPIARVAGAVLGGGLSALQVNSAAKKVLKEAPNEEAVKQVTNQLYDQLRKADIQYNPAQYELAIGRLDEYLNR